FILHKLGLVPTFDRSQLIGTAAGEEDACEGERREAHQQEDSKNNVQETDSSEFFEHSLGFWQVYGASEARLLGVKGYYCRVLVNVSTSFNTDLSCDCTDLVLYSTFSGPGASKVLSAKAREWKLWVATR